MRWLSWFLVGLSSLLLLSMIDFVHEGQARVEVPASPGRAWHVCTSGNGLTGDGSQEHPFRTIQKGIDAAGTADKIFAERGVCVQTINFFGRRSLAAGRCVFDDPASAIEVMIINRVAREAGF